jgi:predicted MPP superfamily phosphohydrolase
MRRGDRAGIKPAVFLLIKELSKMEEDPPVKRKLRIVAISDTHDKQKSL